MNSYGGLARHLSQSILLVTNGVWPIRGRKSLRLLLQLIMQNKRMSEKEYGWSAGILSLLMKLTNVVHTRKNVRVVLTKLKKPNAIN